MVRYWRIKLLDLCADDAKEKGAAGLVILSSKKKMPFLSDPKYLKYKGFLVADTAYPYFELLYRPFHNNQENIPSFKSCIKKGETIDKGWVLYYSNQCPHTEKYAAILKDSAVQRGIGVTLVKIDNVREAQNAPAPFTTYSLFFKGKFITNEILSEKKFLQLLESNQY